MVTAIYTRKLIVRFVTLKFTIIEKLRANNQVRSLPFRED